MRFWDFIKIFDEPRYLKINLFSIYITLRKIIILTISIYQITTIFNQIIKKTFVLGINLIYSKFSLN